MSTPPSNRRSKKTKLTVRQHQQQYLAPLQPQQELHNLVSIPIPRIPITRVVRSRHERSEDSFLMTVFKVGSTLLLILMSCYLVWTYQTLMNSYSPSTAFTSNRKNYNPNLDLDAESAFINPLHQPFLDPNDAFGLAKFVSSNYTAFTLAAEMLRTNFTNRYGGTTMARNLLHAAWISPSKQPQPNTRPHRPLYRLARQIATKISHEIQSEVVILVMGSSAAAGVGNWRHQSYPEVLHKLLQPVIESSSGKLSLRIINLAMEDTFEFPLLWCLEEFTKDQSTEDTESAQVLRPDLVVWDYSDHQASTRAERIEAFIRNMIARSTPMIVFRSIHSDHRSVLQHYAHMIDLVVLMEHDAVKPLLHAPNRPVGLLNYSVFGVTKRSSHSYLSIKRHEWIAFVLSMHVLASLERVHAGTLSKHMTDEWSSSVIPSPLVLNTVHELAWSSLLLNELVMLSMHCYTSFEMEQRSRNMTAIDGRKHEPSSLETIVSSETFGSDQEILLPKPEQLNAQWVLDMNERSKQSKLLSKDSDFYGFPDWKQAFYGIHRSGSLLLHVPLTKQLSATVQTVVVICESSDAADEESCDLRKDVAIQVGKQPADVVVIDSAIVANTFGKPICVQIAVPSSATTKLLFPEDRVPEDNAGAYGLMLPIEVRVTNELITHRNRPCSIAHVLVTQIDV